MYEEARISSGILEELFVLLLLDTFLRFLAGLPTSLRNNWLPGQRILSVHWPWRKGQLGDKNRRGKKSVLALLSPPQDISTWHTSTRQSIGFSSKMPNDPGFIMHFQIYYSFQQSR